MKLTYFYSLYTSKDKKLSSEEVENSFASNICRCTGYRTIADAFKSFATNADKHILEKLQDIEDLGVFRQCKKNCTPESDWCVIENCNNKTITVGGNSHNWFKVYNLQDVFKVIGQSDDYKLLAGNTGQGKTIYLCNYKLSYLCEIQGRRYWKIKIGTFKMPTYTILFSS